MIVRMYMSANLVTIQPDTRPSEAVAVMRRNRIRRLVVTQDGELSGILCHRDLTRAAERMGTTKQVKTVESIMNAQVITIGQEDPIEKAAKLMTKHHIGGLVVVKNKIPIGIITESDIFRAFTFLLSASGKSIRITFDVTKNEDILQYLVDSTKKSKLKLESFLTFKERERFLAIAIISGDYLTSYIDTIWASGRPIVNLVELN